MSDYVQASVDTFGADREKAVVLLSGGQDSTTCFYDALRRLDVRAAISFEYDQRHGVELELAAEHASYAHVEHVVLPIEALRELGAASLTNPRIENTEAGATPADGSWHSRHNLPPSFVPGRNLLFFTLAAAWAIPHDINRIVTGVCGTDHAGYPDCRATFVESMQESIARGMDAPGFTIDAPLLYKTKAETWRLAEQLNIVPLIVERTHTCYEGDRSALHEWGYGCGRCGACVERANGYARFTGVAA
jgi:7-cyano-7-deazaguanine synthase